MRSNNWTVTTLVPLEGDNSPSPSRQLLLCGAIALYFGPCFSFSELWIKDLVKESSLVVSKGPQGPIKITRSIMADQDLVTGLSKLVGYSIVLPAFFVLIPQILKVSIMWPYMIENSTISRFDVSKSFFRSWCFHQVWEAGSGEGLSIPLQAQELAMLVIGCQEAMTLDHPCPCHHDDYYHLHPSSSTV